MTSDELIGFHAFFVMLCILEDLKSERLPLPHGVAMKYRSFIPSKTPDEILESEEGAYWFGYAETMREVIDLLASLPKQVFVTNQKRKI